MPAPGTAAPPGKAIQSARRAPVGSQTLTNLKERLDDLDKEAIDAIPLSELPFTCQCLARWNFGNGVCRAYNTWLAETCKKAPDRLKGVGVVSLQDPQGAAKELSLSKS